MATNPSRLLELTRTISEKTRVIDEFLEKSGLPRPSFEPSTPADFPVPSSNVEIQDARRAVVLATQELHDLMVGPRELVRWRCHSFLDNLSLQAMYQFKVAKAVPIDGETSYQEIAQSCNVDEGNIRRLIRHAMTNRMFRELREGYVAHTAGSTLLLEDSLLNDWVGLNTSEFAKASANVVDAMIKFPGSQEPSEAGFPVAYNLNHPMFVEIGKDPERAKRFSGAMSSLTGGEGYTVDRLVEGYPWADLDKGTVVDVGGSHGFVCVALAEKYPELRFVVQDLPKFVADGPSKIPAELRSRIEFQAHDFFTEQPVQNAEVYLFRWIFHNWSDKYSIKILRSLIPALKTGARIVINDNCLPKANTADLWDEKITRGMDILMLTLLNAKERDEGEWEDLFRAADPRYKFLGAIQPKGSLMYIMEAVWEG